MYQMGSATAHHSLKYKPVHFIEKYKRKIISIQVAVKHKLTQSLDDVAAITLFLVLLAHTQTTFSDRFAHLPTAAPLPWKPGRQGVEDFVIGQPSQR